MHPCDSTKFDVEAMPRGWYALYTRHQHEKSSASLLKNKGFEVLLPLYRVVNQWKDRKQEVLLPLFSNYLFILADLDSKIETLRTPGVCWFVGNAGTPVSISHHEIGALQKLASSPFLFSPYPFLTAGDRVRVRTGALAGVEGFLVREKGQQRVVISVDLLRQSTAVEIDVAEIEPVLPNRSRIATRLVEPNYCS